MRAVLASGEIYQPCFAEMGTPLAGVWKWGVGPYLDGLFTQSNFGIVTKMGFWLYPAPQAFRSGVISVPRREDVHAFVATMARLIYAGIVNSSVMVFSPLLRNVLHDDDAIAALGADSSDTWDRLSEARGVASWSAKANFYGPPAVIAAQWEHVKAEFGVIAGVNFEEGPAYRFPLSETEIEKVPDKSELGIPNLAIFSMGARSEHYPNPADGHLSFSPIIPMTGSALLKALSVFSRAARDWNIAPLGFGAGFCMYPRTFVFLFTLPLSRDPAHNRKARDFFHHVIALGAEHGWGEYRAHPAFMEEITGVYRYNNHALRRVNERIKDALDPGGILAAGR